MNDSPQSDPEGPQQLILLGPASTGSKMTRDLLSSLPDIDKVTFDINYIWKYGNESHPHDEFTADMATPEIVAAIRKRIRRFSNGAPMLIEKTNASSLRIPFINKVFPNAMYIHLTRDPVDVIQSAHRRWQAPPDWKYIFRKARTFPILEAFGYAVSYAKSTLKSILTKKASSWGQVYNGMREDADTRDLIEVCTRQYIRTVESARRDLQMIPAERQITVVYSDLVRNPEAVVNQIGAFLGLSENAFANTDFSHVTDKNIGKGYRELPAEMVERVQALIPEIVNEIHSR